MLLIGPIWENCKFFRFWWGRMGERLMFGKKSRELWFPSKKKQNPSGFSQCLAEKSRDTYPQTFIRMRIRISPVFAFSSILTFEAFWSCSHFCWGRQNLGGKKCDRKETRDLIKSKWSVPPLEIFILIALWQENRGLDQVQMVSSSTRSIYLKSPDLLKSTLRLCLKLLL